MSLTVKGATITSNQPSLGWNKYEGWYQLQTWHGTPAEINAKIVALATAGTAEDMITEPQGDGSVVLRVKYTQTSAAPSGAPDDVAVNDWELIGSEEYRDIKNHEDYNALHPAVLGAIQSGATRVLAATSDYDTVYTQALADIQTALIARSQYPTHTTAAGNLLDVLLRGYTTYPHTVYTLRKSITIASNWHLSTSFANTDKPHNYAATGTGARSPSLEAELGTLPADVISGMELITKPETREWHTWGWVKRGPSMRPTPFRRYGITQEYLLGQWCDEIYDTV